jgi:hypothetical protein
MKKIDSWALCGFLGFIGVGCGGPGNHSQGAENDPQPLTKTTVVKMKADGKHERSSYFATREQIEAKRQAKLAAIQLRKEGASLGNEGASPDLNGDCESWQSIWVWDEEGAGELGGNLCCVTPFTSGHYHGDYVNTLCGYPYIKSLWSYQYGGGYSSMLDCQTEFPRDSTFHVLDCHPYTDYFWIYTECPGGGECLAGGGRGP